MAVLRRRSQTPTPIGRSPQGRLWWGAGRCQGAEGAAVALSRPAAPEEVTKLLLDKPGQALAVAQAGRLRAEGLEVLVDDLVEHTPGGTPRFVARGRQGHAPR
jgi:hypothetical protein